VKQETVLTLADNSACIGKNW